MTQETPQPRVRPHAARSRRQGQAACRWRRRDPALENAVGAGIALAVGGLCRHLPMESGASVKKLSVDLALKQRRHADRLAWSSASSSIGDTPLTDKAAGRSGPHHRRTHLLGQAAAARTWPQARAGDPAAGRSYADVHIVKLSPWDAVWPCRSGNARRVRCASRPTGSATSPRR